MFIHTYCECDVFASTGWFVMADVCLQGMIALILDTIDKCSQWRSMRALEHLIGDSRLPAGTTCSPTSTFSSVRMHFVTSSQFSFNGVIFSAYL